MKGIIISTIKRIISEQLISFTSKILISYYTFSIKICNDRNCSYTYTCHLQYIISKLCANLLGLNTRVCDGTNKRSKRRGGNAVICLM